MLRVITHCCAIERILLATQYSTSPAGKNAKNIVKTTGRTDITFACTGSIGAGFNFCWTNIVMPIIKGKTKNGSATDKSFIHKTKSACLNSTLSNNTQYKEINTGICIRIGKHPPSGFIFSFYKYPSWLYLVVSDHLGTFL